MKGAAPTGDWGMKNRLARLFDPKSGNTVMLAFDHSCIPPTVHNAICLRATHDSSVLIDEMSTATAWVRYRGRHPHECLRRGHAVLHRRGGEAQSLETLCRAVDAGERYGIPVLGVTAVGKEMARTTQSSCWPPGCWQSGVHRQELFLRWLRAGGGRLSGAHRHRRRQKAARAEALEMAYRAIHEGAHGVDMGRNIFQSDCPAGMAQAIGKVVHEGYTPKQAFEVYQEVQKG